MDASSNLILIKNRTGVWENKTNSVSSIEESGGHFLVKFSSQSRRYRYGKDKVHYCKNPESLNLEQAVVHIKDKPTEKWRAAYIFGPLICLERNRYCQVEPRENVEIIYNISDNRQASSVIGYYSHIAQALKFITPHLHFYYQKRLDFVANASIANNFATKAPPNSFAFAGPVIYPFGVNASQREAVVRALESQISVIQGPPGTGKTQTILNIIANLIVEGKTIAVAAGNNSATANVFEKLEKEGLGFLSAMLGNSDLQESFFENNPKIPDLEVWKREERRISKLKIEILETNTTIEDLLTANNQLATAKEKLHQLQLEAKHFSKNFSTAPINLTRFSVRRTWNASDILSLLAEIESCAESNRVSWRTRIKWLIKYKIYRFSELLKLTENTTKSFMAAYYQRKEQELNQSICTLEEKLSNASFDSLTQRSTELSLELLKASLASRYANGSSRAFEADDYKRSFKEFQKRYPIILSTTDSIINNKHQDDLFDYIIVDEASQVDLLTGFLAMTCAKNIVVVGDQKQLPHIPEPSLSYVEPPIDEQYGIESCYSYFEQSLLSSIETIFKDTAPTTLLKEHYRCHPQIINFCNQKFYNGALVTMTRGENDAFQIYRTAPGNHARKAPSGKGLINLRELDVINQEIIQREDLQETLDEVGVISPYRAQADFARSYIADDRIQVDTVYKYQGREKDTIIFSTTANEVNDFVDDPHLLNVAVSRAKNRFILVTSRKFFDKPGSNTSDLVGYIEYQTLSNNIFDSKVISVFDCLYQEYSDVLLNFQKKLKRKSRFLSENLMATLLAEIFLEEPFDTFSYKEYYPLNLLVRNGVNLTDRERQFVSHPNTHVDFLVYNKIDKTTLLVIEVDGYHYHEMNPQQKARDELKDEILKKSGIKILRLSTIGSNEGTAIRKALAEALAK